MSYAAVQHLQLLVEETTAHVGSTLRQTGGGRGKDRVIEEDNKNDGRPPFLVLVCVHKLKNKKWGRPGNEARKGSFLDLMQPSSNAHRE